MAKVTVIGISGGSGSGKSTLAQKALQALGPERCSVVAQDHYYFDQSHRFDGDGGSVNFDHPSSIDFELMAEQIAALKEGLAVEIPVYDFATHSRQKSTQHQEPKEVIVVEGTLLLSQERLRALFDHSFFIDTPEELRFSRRLSRDVKERGRSEDGVKKQFQRQVKPMHDEFVESSKSFAEHVIENHREDAFDALIERLT